MATTSSNISKPASNGAYEHLYGDINPRTQKYCVARLLTRGREEIILDKFAQKIVIPKNHSKTVTARRYKSLAPAVTPLTEGVTPTAQVLQYDDVSTSLAQYGGLIKLTDVVEDTVDDPVLQVMSELCGEQAADTKEALHWNMLVAGSNVSYAGGVTSRSAVTAAITKEDLSATERFFRRNKARTITRMIGASALISTEPVPACYIAFAHSDAKGVFEAMQGFLPVEKYSNVSPLCPNEIGKVGSFRIITSANFTPFTTAGASGTGNYSGGNGSLPATAAKADVYSCVCIAADSYAVTPLAGMEAATMYVHSPGKSSSTFDPMGQRGCVAWKMYDASMILNELWVKRIEFAIPGATASTGGSTSGGSGSTTP